MNHLKLTKEKLDLDAIQNLVLDSACGAVSIFCGITRDNFEDKKVCTRAVQLWYKNHIKNNCCWLHHWKLSFSLSFFFTARTRFEQVIKLEYEAYDAMALKAATKICDDMRAKWSDIKHIAIYHRLGVVPVRESSVIIAVSSPHRQTSLDSVQFAIDELKRTVPIWKKEIYDTPETTGAGAIDNNGGSWKENSECYWLKN